MKPSLTSVSRRPGTHGYVTFIPVETAKKVHIQLQLDNTTAVSYVNNMGALSHNSVMTLPRKCHIERKMWLSSAHLPEIRNVTTDKSVENLMTKEIKSSVHQVLKTLHIYWETLELILFPEHTI